MLAEFSALKERALEEFATQSRLIKSSVADMAVLGKIPVLDALARKGRERSGETDGSVHAPSAGGGSGQERTIASYINSGKMQQVRDTCKATHGELEVQHFANAHLTFVETQTRNFDRLVEQMEDLQLQSDAERTAAEEGIKHVMREFEGGVERMQGAIQRLEEIFDADADYNISQGRCSTTQKDLTCRSHGTRRGDARRSRRAHGYKERLYARLAHSH